MKNSCIKTRALINGDPNGSSKNIGEVKTAKAHIAECASCRDFALDRNLSDLLKESFDKQIHGPSPSFFVNLSRKIEDMNPPGEFSLFSELLMSSSLKLVPAMAALLFIITTTLAVFYENSSAETVSSIEEKILFDEGEISTDSFLHEILNTEVKNGN